MKSQAVFQAKSQAKNVSIEFPPRMAARAARAPSSTSRAARRARRRDPSHRCAGPQTASQTFTGNLGWDWLDFFLFYIFKFCKIYDFNYFIQQIPLALRSRMEIDPPRNVRWTLVISSNELGSRLPWRPSFQGSLDPNSLLEITKVNHTFWGGSISILDCSALVRSTILFTTNWPYRARSLWRCL